jgi:long-chain fatty acid transport protein
MKSMGPGAHREQEIINMYRLPEGNNIGGLPGGLMKQFSRITVSLVFAMATAISAMATNGDNLIGIGPVSRSMGGVGVAAPQDSITAIFDNPAAMGFCPCGQSAESIFGATIFDPTVKAKIRTPMGTMKGESEHQFFLIPAVGITSPINDDLRFGIGAYGISGMGVDYGNKGWDLDPTMPGFEGDLYTKIEVMRFAPMLSYKFSDNFAAGASLIGNYTNIDLASGGSHDYALGAQLGGLYSLGKWQFGASYTTPQKTEHERLYNFDAFTGDPYLDTLDMESPAAYIAGVAFKPNRQWLFEVDGKYYTWSDTDGYGDFDWDDQFVIAAGVQFMPTDKIALRGGFNWGENPVNEHNGWDPMGVTNLQGKQVPTMGYEMMRIIGLPAVVESHLTCGIGYWITDSIHVNFDYMHAFEETISETSAGNMFELESSLYENSYSFSLGWTF